MKRNFNTVLILIITISMIFTTNAWANKEKTIKLLYGTFDPPTSMFAPAINDWCKEIKEKTNNAINVEVMWGIGKNPEIYPLLDKGLIDIGFITPSSAGGIFPMSEITGLPWKVPSAELGSKAFSEWVKLGYLDKEFSVFKVLHYVLPEANPLFTTKKNINNVSQLKGMKIFAGNLTTQERVKLMGGVSVVVPFPDLYISLQKGIMDGYFMMWPLMEVLKLFEVTKYAMEPSIGTGTIVIGVNENKWEKIPTNLKKIIEEVSSKYPAEFGKAADITSEKGKQLFINNGGKIKQWSPEEYNKLEELIQPIWGKWISEMEAKKLPAKDAVRDMYRVFEDFGIKDPGVGYRALN